MGLLWGKPTPKEPAGPLQTCQFVSKDQTFREIDKNINLVQLFGIDQKDGDAMRNQLRKCENLELLCFNSECSVGTEITKQSGKADCELYAQLYQPFEEFLKNEVSFDFLRDLKSKLKGDSPVVAIAMICRDGYIRIKFLTMTLRSKYYVHEIERRDYGMHVATETLLDPKKCQVVKEHIFKDWEREMGSEIKKKIKNN